MPVLKNITCNVEWSGSNTPLREYQTSYSDGYVETYIAVPQLSPPFSIHLQSNGYISPGLAMFVYMDGVYQCNRNRSNLKVPFEGSSKTKTDVDFRVRQKEEGTMDGTFRGKQWQFARVNVGEQTASHGNSQAMTAVPFQGEYVGTIEVVVLRCYPLSEVIVDERDEPILLGAMFDGASDAQTVPFSLDGASGISASPPDKQRHHKKSKPEKIEIHNSNVHIYHAASKSHKRSQSSHINQPKTHHYTSSDYESSGRVSPREQIAEILSKQGGSSYNRPYLGSSLSRVMQIRGGAAGSYTAGDDDWGAQKAENPAGNNSGWNTDKGIITGKYDVAQNAEQCVIGWNAAESSSGPKPWSSPGKGTDEQGAWNAESADQVTGNKADAAVWDPVGNPAEERDAWGESAKEDQGAVADNREGPTWENDGSANQTDRNSGEHDNSWDNNKDTQHSSNDWSKTGNINNQLQDTNRGTTGSSNPGVEKDSWGQSNDQSHEQTGGWPQAGEIVNNEGRNNDQGNESSNGQNWNSNGGDWNNDNGSGKQNDNVQPGGNGNNTSNFNANHGPNGSSQNAPEFNDSEPTIGSTAPGKKERFGKGKSPTPKSAMKTSTSQGKPKPDSSIPTPNMSTSKKRAPSNSFKPTFTSSKNPPPSQRKVSNESKPFNVPGQWSPPMQRSHTVDSQAQQAPPSFITTPPASTPAATQKAPKPQSKPYWSSWRGNLPQPITPDSAITPLDDPIYTLPSTLTTSRSLTHQVLPMQATAYRHRRAKPNYMDTYDDPYAVFVFKYRDTAVIESMLGMQITDPVGEKARLASLSKEELVEELLKAKGAASMTNVTPSTPAPAPTPPMPMPMQPATTAWQPTGGWAVSDQGVAAPVAVENRVQNDNWGKNPKGAGPWTQPMTKGYAGVDVGGGSSGGGGQEGQSGNNDNGGNEAGWSNDDNKGDEGEAGGNDGDSGGGGGGQDWGNGNAGGSDEGKGGDDQQKGSGGGGEQGGGSWEQTDGDNGGGGGWDGGNKTAKEGDW
ncbi:uncharacterized protein KY384_004221 [Bacidia gigantensis]|uniref:uncharacterized protein n=1 Tax=Bacidia gigantensis TaxID=2732470 RepID=UPI001D0433FC|nr:uncharacterized protein KY384_004221 [Bacidia gigantensis]KAG8530864.1 hypothetical protein KY384_004221 [Bacidia gigantensis]